MGHPIMGAPSLVRIGFRMLVLSRKKNQKIIIGDDIIITIVLIKGDQVRVGIEAPKEVSVHREEVYNAIKSEKKEG